MNSNEILNKYINLIDKGYCSDCNELNCIDNFPHSKITHAIRELQQENQELKLELSGYRQAILEDKAMLGLKEENAELKKQLEEKENIACNWKDSCLENAGKIEKLENQQKEFIEYMNKTIEELECEDVDDEEMKGYLIQRIDTFKEILRKYKSIIGVSDEKEN